MFSAFSMATMMATRMMLIKVTVDLGKRKSERMMGLLCGIGNSGRTLRLRRCSRKAPRSNPPDSRARKNTRWHKRARLYIRGAVVEHRQNFLTIFCAIRGWVKIQEAAKECRASLRLCPDQTIGKLREMFEATDFHL